MHAALSPLPCPCEALEPYISRTTLEFHQDKHHKAYVDQTKALAKEVRLADLSLELLIQQTARRDRHHLLFNNAAQAWNHAFCWRSLRPSRGDEPDGAIADRIRSDFGSERAVAEQLAAATGQFGRGWAWLADKRTSLMPEIDAVLRRFSNPGDGMDEVEILIDTIQRRLTDAQPAVEQPASMRRVGRAHLTLSFEEFGALGAERG